MARVFAAELRRRLGQSLALRAPSELARGLEERAPDRG
jgi:hypothetical protein